MTRAKKKKASTRTKKKTTQKKVVKAQTDILGHRLTAVECDVQEIYKALKKLAGKKNLPPCVSSNAKVALAAMWQVMNDLNIKFEQLYDVGV